MYENVLMRVYARVCVRAHGNYSRSIVMSGIANMVAPPNLGGKCRSNGNLVIIFVEPIFWRAKRFYIPNIFKTARKTK